MCVQVQPSNKPVYKLRWAKSKALLDAYIARYNADKCLKDQLRAGHRRLAEHLLYLHQIEIAKEQKYGLWGGGAELWLPMLRTNNEQLCGALGCSDRTVMNLRKRLQMAGIITAYKWHGTNSSYELALSPAILHIAPYGDPENRIGRFVVEGAGREAAGGAAGAPPMQNLRHTIVTSNKTGTNKLNKLVTRSGFQSPGNAEEAVLGTVGNHAGHVESPLAMGSRPDTEPGTKGTGYETAGDPAGTAPPVAAPPPTDELSADEAAALVAAALAKPIAPGAEAGEAAPEDTCEEGGIRPTAPETLEEALRGLPKDLADRLGFMCASLWAHAERLLYANVVLEAAEVERGRARLAEYFLYAQPSLWASGYEQVMTRINLVAAWITRGLEEKPGAPVYDEKSKSWHVVGAKKPVQRWVALPSIYFDIRAARRLPDGRVTPNHFPATKEWYWRHVAGKKQRKEKAMLTKWTRAYLNALSQTAIGSNPMQVYTAAVQYLGKLNPNLVKQFRGNIDAAVNGKAQ